MNCVQILGRLGQDPEIRYTQSGKAVCSFSVAISEGRDKTTWVRCTAWEKTAEIMGQYMTKGSIVAVEGRLVMNEYTNKDGVEVKTLQVSAFRVHFGEPKSAREDRQQGGGRGGYGGGNGYQQPHTETRGGGYSDQVPYADDEDIPFAFDPADEWTGDSHV